MNAPGRGYSLEFIRSMLSDASGRSVGWFKDLELKSVFQPIFSLTHKRSIGFDASVRSMDAGGQPVAAETLFGPVQNFAETSMLDLLCSTLHIQNYFAQHPPHALLFLNLHPDVFLDSQHTAEFLSEAFRHYRVPSGRIVIDIPGSVLQSQLLQSALIDYRRIGCPIAVADFGTDNRDLDTVWDCQPIMVKMAPSVIADVIAERRVRQSLPHAVSLLHEMGTLVLMGGIETEMQALLAIDADVDFASGFYFGSPIEEIEAYVDSPSVLESLWSTYKQKSERNAPAGAQSRASLQDEMLRSSQIRKLQSESKEEIKWYRESRRPFLAAMEHAAAAVGAGRPLDSACAEFLGLRGAIRCYLLDANGQQNGAEVLAPHPPAARGMDFHSLAVPAEPEWFRRDFFRRARKEPAVVQVTRKYCSLAGHVHCVTFSVGFTLKNKPVVLCGDVDWSQQKH